MPCGVSIQQETENETHRYDPLLMRVLRPQELWIPEGPPHRGAMQAPRGVSFVR